MIEENSQTYPWRISRRYNWSIKGGIPEELPEKNYLNSFGRCHENTPGGISEGIPEAVHKWFPKYNAGIILKKNLRGSFDKTSGRIKDIKFSGWAYVLFDEFLQELVKKFIKEIIQELTRKFLQKFLKHFLKNSWKNSRMYSWRYEWICWAGSFPRSWR